MDSFHIIPVGSIYSRKNIVTMEYLDIIEAMPDSLRNLVGSTDAASYIRGLARTYDISEEQTPSISFAILEVCVGKKTFAQLPAVLSTELKLPNDKAQKIAAELEKDVFTSIKEDLDQFLRQQKSKESSITSKIGMVAPRASTPLKNVLNLKELNPPKSAGQLPPKPPRFPLPPASRTGQGNQNGIKTPPPPIRFT